MLRKIALITILSIISLIVISQTTIASPQMDSTATVEAIIDDSIDIFVDNYDYTLDGMIHEWYIENMITIDCTKDSNIAVFYPDSLYIERLQKLPHYMEMPFNSIVKGFIEMYAKRQKQVSNMLGIGEHYYFPMFEASLSKYNVPLELRFLPVIESGLNARATSHMGAAGLWQFMVRTGKQYGLEVNSMVDERRNPLKSSDAAARYMKDLYDIYGDWHLVIAAYNCGPGNVAKAIRRANGKRGYWDIYPYLPKETRSYVPIFIAANYIMNYYEEHNICPATPITKALTDTIMISDRVHFRQICDVTGVNYEELKFLNPQYVFDIVPGEYKAYPLILPISHINSYANNRDTILRYMPELAKREMKVDPAGYAYSGNGKVIYYRIQNGDYLGKIANKFGVKVSQIKRWNNINGTFIRAGQKLKIYK